MARYAFALLGEKTVDIQYYIWEGDVTGRILLSALIKAADAAVQISGPCPAFSLGLWSHRPALPSAPASVVRTRLLARATATISDLAGDHDSRPSRLRK
jgi:phosphatidylserine/phosphatidylglycerophosphate/cardiolipin synthase-like enzyme